MIKEKYRANIDVHIDCRLGTIADQSGNGNDGTYGGTPYWAGRSLKMDGVADYIDIGNAGGSIKTIVIVFKEDDITANTDYIVDLNGTDYISVVNGTVTVNGFGGATTNVFVNGVDGNTIADTGKIYHVTIISDTGFTASDMDIGRLEGTGFFGGQVFECFTLTNELSQFEVAQLYEEYAEEGNYNSTPDKTRLPQILAHNEFGLDSIWTKGTGWTIAGGKASSDGSQAADSDLTQNVGAVGDFYTIEYELSGYSAGNITALAGTAEGTDRAANGVYIEGVTAAGNGLLGLRADLDFVGDVDWIRISEGSQLDYYVDGKDWNESVGNVTAGFLENSSWVVDSGTYQIDDAGNANGTKQITNVAAGIISKNSSQAFGTFQMDFQLDTSTDTINWDFIWDGTNGYRLQIGNDVYKITEIGVGDVVTGTWTSDTDSHTAKVTRNAAGSLTLYLDGVSTGIPASDLTVVTSTIQKVDADAGNAVRNFKFSPVIQ